MKYVKMEEDSKHTSTLTKQRVQTCILEAKHVIALNLKKLDGPIIRKEIVSNMSVYIDRYNQNVFDICISFMYFLAHDVDVDNLFQL